LGLPFDFAVDFSSAASLFSHLLCSLFLQAVRLSVCLLHNLSSLAPGCHVSFLSRDITALSLLTAPGLLSFKSSCWIQSSPCHSLTRRPLIHCKSFRNTQRRGPAHEELGLFYIKALVPSHSLIFAVTQSSFSSAAPSRRRRSFQQAYASSPHVLHPSQNEDVRFLTILDSRNFHFDDEYLRQ
jgi:hypothetical protein